MKTKCFDFCLKAKFIFIWSGSTVQRAELALEKDAIRAKTAWSGGDWEWLKWEREMEQQGNSVGNRALEIQSVIWHLVHLFPPHE